MTTLNDKIDTLTNTLQSCGLEDPRREARLIVRHAAGLDLAFQITSGARELSAGEIQAIDHIAARRAAGEPLSRIVGKREFYGLDFSLSPATLDPRPETEVLVGHALAWLKTRAGAPGPSLVDLGTGTGCIPIAILKNLAGARAVAVDVSPEALATAAANARAHGVEDRLALIESDWFSALSNVTFDLVVSNPPYIRADEIPNLAANVRDFDPVLALVGGADGLDPYRIIFKNIHKYLKPDGAALFEIGAGQCDDVTRLAVKSGLDVWGVWDDDAGIPRVVGVSVHKIKNIFDSGA